MRRQLRTLDILCLGVNAIVGSGIFLIPGRLIAESGPYSIGLFLVCGLLLIPIGLCFAEAGSRVDRNGGPYNYASIAFGHRAGFSLGWIAVVTSIFSYAAVANGLPQYMGTFIPGADQGWVAHTITAVVIAVLTLLNVRGVRLGANVVNLFTVSKLVPLVIIAAVGIFFIHPAQFSPTTPLSTHAMGGLLLAVLFTYQGFEVAPVPANETVNPARSVPIAVMGSLVLSGILYMVIQTVLVGSGAPVSGSEQPLSDAATFMLGGWGGTLIAVGAVVSMAGYCAGIAFNAPRFLTVLCEDRFLPAIGAKIHPKFETPFVASIFIAVVTFVFSLFLDFNRLVDMSALAVALQYLVTSMSIPALRKKTATTGETYVMPGRWLMPILGTLISIIFIFQVKQAELVWCSLTVIIGLVVAFVTRRLPGGAKAR